MSLKQKNTVIINNSNQEIYLTTVEAENILTVLSKNKTEILRINNNGDFYIKGKLITNDKDIPKYFKKVCYNDYKNKLKEEINNNPEMYQDILLELRRLKTEKLLNGNR